MPFAVVMLPQTTEACSCSSMTREPGSPEIVSGVPCTVVTVPAGRASNAEFAGANTV